MFQSTCMSHVISVVVVGLVHLTRIMKKSFLGRLRMFMDCTGLNDCSAVSVVHGWMMAWNGGARSIKHIRSGHNSITVIQQESPPTTTTTSNGWRVGVS